MPPMPLATRLAPLFVLLAALGACQGGRSTTVENPPPDPGGTPLEPPLEDSPLSCPAAVDVLQAAEILPELLPDEALLEEWQIRMVDYGIRFTGSPALAAFHDFLAAELQSYGLDVQREPVPVHWWEHQEWSLDLLSAEGEEPVPVAAYFPYSGQTPAEGVTAELVDVGTGLAPDFALADVQGKIAFFEVDLLPLTMALFYATASYVHDPDFNTLPTTPYDKMSLSILTPQLSILPPEQITALALAEQMGAVGAVISLDASAANAAGQYTPFHAAPGHHQVPSLYLDRATGDALKARIGGGQQARLRLLVQDQPEGMSDDIIATLPGQSDEVIIINSHTDGTSASEENGTLAVLALARYFSRLPQHCRQRTMVFVLTPGHFQGGLDDTGRFIANHPEIIARAVGSVTPEHLGQQEWLDDAQGYHPSGLPEPGVFYGSYAPAMQSIMTQAVIAEDLRRVIVSRPIGPIYFGVGSPLNQAGVPNAGYLTGPHALYSWAENQHLNKMDYERMAAEIRTMTRVVAAIDGTEKAVLCAGMTPPLNGSLGPCLGSVLP
ncbi:MAG: hypothetical protein ACPHCJ_02740 [Oceanococcaceae bacterium]